MCVRYPCKAHRQIRSLRPLKGEFLIDSLLVRNQLIIVMMRWSGFAPWEFEFSLPASLTSTFLVVFLNLLGSTDQNPLCVLKLYVLNRDLGNARLAFLNPSRHSLNRPPSWPPCPSSPFSASDAGSMSISPAGSKSDIAPSFENVVHRSHRIPMRRSSAGMFGTVGTGSCTGLLPEDRGPYALTPNTVELIPTLEALFS